MAYDFSLAFLTVSDVTPAQAVSIAAETGYSQVGFRLLPAGGESDYPIMTDLRVLREAKAAIKDTGVRLADIEIIRIGEYFSIEETLAFLDRGAQLEARHVLVAGDDSDEARLTNNYGKFCEAAARFNMTADLEFMPWTQVPDIVKAERIITAVNQPNAGLLVDALHYHRAGTTPDQVKKVSSERLNYAQFCDAAIDFDPSTEGLIAIARGKRLNPGDGEIDLVSLLQALPSDIVLSLEVPNLELTKVHTPLQRASTAFEGMQKVIAAAEQLER